MPVLRVLGLAWSCLWSKKRAEGVITKKKTWNRNANFGNVAIYTIFRC
ncbi:MAG: hypothetical protein AB9861_09975 [Methanosarcina sp.]